MRFQDGCKVSASAEHATYLVVIKTSRIKITQINNFKALAVFEHVSNFVNRMTLKVFQIEFGKTFATFKH